MKLVQSVLFSCPLLVALFLSAPSRYVSYTELMEDSISEWFDEAMEEIIGGGTGHHFQPEQLMSFVQNTNQFINHPGIVYNFKESNKGQSTKGVLQCNIPLHHEIIAKINAPELRLLSLYHYIYHTARVSKAQLVKSLQEHVCSEYPEVFLGFETVEVLTQQQKDKHYRDGKGSESTDRYQKWESNRNNDSDIPKRKHDE